MESRREREIRGEVERLEVDAQSATGSSVLLAPAERKRFESVRARIAELRRLLGIRG